MNYSSLRGFADRGVLLTWLALTGCSVLSWVESPLGRPPTPIVLLVLALTAAKVLLIIGSYMEVARAPRWLQIICGTWVVTVTLGLTVLVCAIAP